MPSIGVCMIVKNEANVIHECLRSIFREMDEIVVVDTGSTDGTQEIVKSYGAKVLQDTWNQNFAAMRNRSIDAASTDYVLVLDADERVERKVRRNIDTFIASYPDALGSVVIRSPLVDESGDIRIVRSLNTRLFPRSHDIRYEGAIHEQVIDASQRRSRIDTGIEIWHEGYRLSPPILQAKTERNISILSSEYVAKPNNGYYAYQLGKSYESLKDFETARSYYERALQSSSPDEAFYPELVLAALYNCKKLRLQEPLWGLLQRSITIFPTLVDLHFFMGRALIEFQIPNLELIRTSFETCLALGNTSAKRVIVEGVDSYLAAYNVGVYHESTGNFQQARDYYNLSAKLGYPRATLAFQRITEKS